MKSNQLRIDNPCPVLLGRMKKQDDGYFCKSCAKTVVDFREKTEDEIASLITEDTCGVFYNHQLNGQKRTSRMKQFAFYLLTVLSFLGFSVKPISAQNNTTSSKGKVKIAQQEPKKEKENKKEKERRKIRKGKAKKTTYGRVVGTPAF